MRLRALDATTDKKVRGFLDFTLWFCGSICIGVGAESVLVGAGTGLLTLLIMSRL